MSAYLPISFAFSALLTATGTGLVRRYALSRSLLDVPNLRSSHSRPTPRGGGLAVVVVTLAGVALAAGFGLVTVRLFAALLGGAVLVAAVGWLDDRRGLGASRRAAAHFIAALWAVAWLGGLPSLQLGVETWHFGPIGSLVAVLMIVWLINLYNFMDGIDGLAAGNALVVAVFGTLILIRQGDAGLSLVTTLLAGTSAGFLIWNWPAARIFMGDIGSGFLGYLFGVIALASEGHGRMGIAIWILLLGVFIFDATVTLVRRALKGEQWYDAHRSHAYQRLVQSGWTHLAVTSAVMVLDCVLGSAALLLAAGNASFLWVALGAVTALGILYLLVERIKPMEFLYGRSG